MPLKSSKYPSIALDLDHTIALYHDRALSRLIYSCVTEALITICAGRYPRSIFEQRLSLQGRARSISEPPTGEPAWIAERARVLEESWELLQRGLVVDFKTGDLLKLSYNGHVLKAWHGLTSCSDDDIERKYPGRLWPSFPQLQRMEKIPHAFVQLTAFDWPSQLSICQCVHHFDSSRSGDDKAEAGTGAGAVAPLDDGVMYAQIMKDHISSFDFIFDNVKALNSGRGGYFDAIINSPLTYVIPRPRLAEALRAIRNERVEGRKRQAVFLVTNSHMQYAELILNVSLGPEWRTLFDLIIVNAQKGGFFTMERAFRVLDAHGREDGEITHSIDLRLSDKEEGKIYSSGNHRALRDLTLALMDASSKGIALHSLTAHLSQEGTHVESITVNNGSSSSSYSHDVHRALQTPNSKSLYLGDHLHGDVHSAMMAEWDAVAVLEEFTTSTDDNDNNTNSESTSPWGASLRFNSPTASWVESLSATATTSINNIETIL